MRMEGGGASKGMRGEEKEEGEDPKASADPAGNQGREVESKQRKGKGREANIVSYPRHPHLHRSLLRRRQTMWRVFVGSTSTQNPMKESDFVKGTPSTYSASGIGSGSLFSKHS